MTTTPNTVGAVVSTCKCHSALNMKDGHKSFPKMHFRFAPHNDPHGVLMFGSTDGCLPCAGIMFRNTEDKHILSYSKRFLKYSLKADKKRVPVGNVGLSTLLDFWHATSAKRSGSRAVGPKPKKLRMLANAATSASYDSEDESDDESTSTEDELDKMCDTLCQRVWMMTPGDKSFQQRVEEVMTDDLFKPIVARIQHALGVKIHAQFKDLTPLARAVLETMVHTECPSDKVKDRIRDTAISETLLKVKARVKDMMAGI